MSWDEDKADAEAYRISDERRACPCCGEDSPEVANDVFECPNGTLFTTDL